MKEKLLNFIICPVCKKEFSTKSFKDENGETKDGMLICQSGHFFPIVNFVPRIMAGDLRHMLYGQFAYFFVEYKNLLPQEKLNRLPDFAAKKKEETSKSFAYEWQKFSKMLQEWKKNFGFYFEPVKDIGFLRDKAILEIGCGKGRHTMYAADIAKEVIAVDFGMAVDVALENNKDKKNVYFVQADIYNLPFREKSFDFIFSLGVLHHLPTPEEGFGRLVNLLKNNGKILLYVYHSFPKNSFNYYLLGLVNAFRNITTRIPHNSLYILCYPIAFLSYVILVLPYKLFFKKVVKNGWPLAMYSEYPFQVLLNDTFDRFSAPIENRYSKEQIVKWYQNAGLRNIDVLGGSGWRIFGEK